MEKNISKDTLRGEMEEDILLWIRGLSTGDFLKVYKNLMGQNSRIKNVSKTGKDESKLKVDIIEEYQGYLKSRGRADSTIKDYLPLNISLIVTAL